MSGSDNNTAVPVGPRADPQHYKICVFFRTSGCGTARPLNNLSSHDSAGHQRNVGRVSVDRSQSHIATARNFSLQPIALDGYASLQNVIAGWLLNS